MSIANRWSTGPSKKPWICAVCRSTVRIRLAPGGLEQVGDQPGRDRLPAAVLLVLPRVRVERQHHRDPLGRPALQRVDHDQGLHDPGVHRLASSTARRTRPSPAPTPCTGRRSRRWRTRRRRSASARRRAPARSPRPAPGNARPEKSIRLLRFSATMLPIGSALSRDGLRCQYHPYRHLALAVSSPALKPILAWQTSRATPDLRPALMAGGRRALPSVHVPRRVRSRR